MNTWGRSVMVLVVLTVPLRAVAQNDGRTQATQPSSATRNASYADENNRWLASGFVGSNFANNANPASFNAGGSVEYLLKNRYGAEVDIHVAPEFQLQNNFFGYGNKPMVNTYMANGIWTWTVGPEKQIRPYVSGGIGALQLRTSFDSGVTSIDANATRFGGNVGAGGMVFVGPWGFKADVRYYRATGSYSSTYVVPGSTGATSPSPTPGPSPIPTPGPSPTPSPNPSPGPYVGGSISGSLAVTAPLTTSALDAPTATALARSAVTGLHYWQGNAGVVFRW